MRFLLDQNMRARLVLHLRARGHDATRVGRHHPAGLSDPEILALARAEGRILLTQDRDFVDLVFTQKLPHAGLVHFQLGNATLLDWQARLDTLLADHGDELAQQRFLVVTPDAVTART
jgi:predicted nuclease of predicted toxin-antitoxin system